MRRSSAGRLFHTDGPETEKARRPNAYPAYPLLVVLFNLYFTLYGASELRMGGRHSKSR